MVLLQHNKFVFWYTRRTPGVRTQSSYEDNIKQIMDFSAVEGFWVCYCHLARPSSLPSPTDLHLLKQGIRPLWEDSANCNGGKWIIRFKKAVSRVTKSSWRVFGKENRPMLFLLVLLMFKRYFVSTVPLISH
ncbi:eukaryotic translation initiation factor NCBP [Artemisia annua]|uniref:mRNA cap-binding protein n=1 Tax=Artemisia annua TaxID=35608 RepID=A0A2U1PLQ5_ARTAN|nr:eukaryotic translation initiation factor NCBP [Artemisia annua]